MTDTTARYHRLAEGFTARVSAVPTERWESPSPCEGWTARDVVRHVVDSHHAFPRLAGFALPEGPTVDDDPVRAWAHARNEMQSLLSDPTCADAEYEGYGGRSTLASAVDSFLCFDLIVHGWDLARAAGLDETIAAEDVADAFDFAERMGETLRRSGACGPALDVPPGADEQTRLLAFLGRAA